MSKFEGITVNPELPVILSITLILILGGLAILTWGGNTSFNFYSSKITADGMNIHEELHFKPNKPYHTLYRNFENQIYSFNEPNINSKNYILIRSVTCSHGNNYFKDYRGKAYPENYAYTDSNEYGCSFGSIFGFFKGEDYTVSSEYVLYPENLFLINGKYYIKFIAYSSNNHKNLNPNNFIVNQDIVKKKRYVSNEDVILYIPYNRGISGFNIIEQTNFKFDSGFSFLKILFSILPGLLVFGLWFFTGKERAYEDIPKEISVFPSERSAWEVSTYFNLPLAVLDKNVFSSVLLKFYNEKVIEIKEKGKEVFIKLNEFKGDEVEKNIYEILKITQSSIRKDKDAKYLDGEYFNLKGFTNSFYYRNTLNKPLLDSYKNLKEKVENKGKEYIYSLNKTYLYIFLIFLVFLPLSWILESGILPNLIFIPYFIMMLIIFVFSFNNAIFSRFKGEHYIEYQKWEAFKRYLKNSFSIKTATHKTVIIWNQYLIYATALGVPDKVIKELKLNNLISEHQTRIYVGISKGSFFGTSFFSSPGAGRSGGSGGGFSGAGGGGVGGGGGGGR